MRINNTGKVVLGVAAVAGAGLLAWHFGLLGGSRSMYAEYYNPKAPRPASTLSGLYQARARIARGNVSKGQSGITNVGQYDSGGVGWHAGGFGGSPKLDPGPWSYLTARNANYTLARTPTTRLLRAAPPGLPHMRVCGAMGYTSIPEGVIYRY